MVRPIRLVSGFLTVGFWTLMSRILGFVRDILIAAFLGAGPVAEAFLVAFSLPNMFRRFFAEGAFNTAFVPLFSKKFEAGEDPQRFAQDAFSGLASILIVLTLIAQLVMPWLVLAMAAGFAGDERLAAGHGLRAHRVRLHPLHLARRAAVGRSQRHGPLRRRRRRAPSAERDPDRGAPGRDRGFSAPVRTSDVEGLYHGSFLVTGASCWQGSRNWRWSGSRPRAPGFA
jgi:hypothetical protein